MSDISIIVKINHLVEIPLVITKMYNENSKRNHKYLHKLKSNRINFLIWSSLIHFGWKLQKQTSSLGERFKGAKIDTSETLSCRPRPAHVRDTRLIIN